MRILLRVLVLAALLSRPAAAEEPREGAGVRWAGGVEEAFRRAGEEGRAVFVAVNALENEGANIALATEHYPSADWGEATRGFVCLVANPNDHAGPDGLCSRYPGIPCSAHRAALDWVTARLGFELISPQHLLVEPEGEVGWRREYFTSDVTPELVESLLSSITPRAAIRRASAARRERIAAIETAPAPGWTESGIAWIHSGDPLAAAGIAALLEWTEDKERRLALVRALARCPPSRAALVQEVAERAIFDPDDDPDQTEAWVAALLEVDPAAGARAASRVIVRTKDLALASRVAEAAKARSATAGLAEAFLLAGRPAPEGLPAPEDARRLARARRRAREQARMFPPLAQGVASGVPGDLRGALVEADAEEVRASAEEVGRIALSGSPERVRIAAALALLRAGRPLGEAVVELLVAAVEDPVEGPEAREEAVARLGADPGGDPDEWRKVLRAAGRGAR